MCQKPNPQLLRCAADRGPRRLKLWQLDPRLHCSVIGTCLSLEDLRRACKRIGLQRYAPVSDYELHHTFVAMADRPLPVIRLLHKTLERRHRETIARFSALDAPEALAAAWRHAVQSGDIPGAYWALLTLPQLPEPLRERISGEVHMLSHLSGASQRADLQRQHALQRQVASMRDKLARSERAQQRRHQEHTDTVQRLRQRLRQAARSERQLADAQARLQAFENDRTVTGLRRQVETYAAQLAESRLRSERAESARQEARAAADRAHRAQQALEQDLHALSSERDALEALLQTQLQERCADTCGNGNGRRGMDLCGRCILYVGGRQSVTAHLEQLVQRCNGRLLCHDGGQEDNRAHLANLLPQADAVVCPVDCVSHDAYRRVKQFCKRYAKRLIVLPSASLSSFARSLHELTPSAG